MKAMKYPRAIPRTKSQEKEKSRSSGKFSASVMLVLGLLSLGVTWSAMPWRQAVASDSCGPCERAYVEAVQQLNLPGGYDAKATVCKAAIPDAPRTSQHPLILGLGPGTTATRSFALAVNNLGKSVLHWSVWRGRNGEWLSDESTPQKFAIDKLVAGLEGKEGNDVSYFLPIFFPHELAHTSIPALCMHRSWLTSTSEYMMRSTRCLTSP
jgi:hypothetical protein